MGVTKPLVPHVPPVIRFLPITHDAPWSMADQSVSDLLLINSDIAARALSDRGLVEALRDGHRAGCEAVERMLLSEQPPGCGEANHLLVWAAWRHGDVLGAKLVSVFPGNQAAGRGDTNTTLFALFDGTSGAVRALFHGPELTLRKTAADSALAADYLARRDARVLLVVGSGRQAPYQARAMRAVRPALERILVWARDPAKAAALAADLAAPDCPAEAAADLAAAVGEADIVSCATSAQEPLVRGAWLKPGTHLDLVGSFTPEMREADDEAVRRASVFVDTWRFASLSGDIAGPLASGALTPEGHQADLFQLCRGDHPGRRTEEEITLFKNAGGGHLDLMAAAAIHRAVTASH
jgi:ornithine cyclodeaminase/alanine dehydrogenase-like protein (mu-crystallin family)